MPTRTRIDRRLRQVLGIQLIGKTENGIQLGLGGGIEGAVQRSSHQVLRQALLCRQ